MLADFTFRVAADPAFTQDFARFRGRIVDVGSEELMVEISGRESKIEAFIERARPFGILELVRTGRIAMVRGRLLDEQNADDGKTELS